jgi:hypothetical protein
MDHFNAAGGWQGVSKCRLIGSIKMTTRAWLYGF